MDKIRELKDEAKRRNETAEREAFRQIAEQYTRLPLMIDCGEHCELSEELTRSMNDLVARRDGTPVPHKKAIVQLLEFRWSFPSAIWQSVGSRLVCKPTRLYFANTLAFFHALQLLCDWAAMLARLAKDLDSPRYSDSVECLSECRKWLDNEGGCPHLDAAALAECLVRIHRLLLTESALADKPPRPRSVIISGLDERAQAELAQMIRTARRKPKKSTTGKGKQTPFMKRQLEIFRAYLDKHPVCASYSLITRARQCWNTHRAEWDKTAENRTGYTSYKTLAQAV